MVTYKDLFEVLGNKVVCDIQKSMIRRKFSPDVAEGMCAIIDRYEMTERMCRFLKEYNGCLQKI